MTMNLEELAASLELRNFTPSLESRLDTQIVHAVASDVLSDLLAGAHRGALLVTGLSHLNVVAVAARGGMPAVLVASGARPDSLVVERACKEGVVLLGTELSRFDASGRLYALGLRGGPS